VLWSDGHVVVDLIGWCDEPASGGVRTESVVLLGAGVAVASAPRRVPEVLDRADGLGVAGGGGTAVSPAAASFRLFTGREPDEERRRQDFAELARSGS
jgi:hypothetical protein